MNGRMAFLDAQWRIALSAAAVSAVVAAFLCASADAQSATNVSPSCSLYVVVLSADVLTQAWNSPSLRFDPKKWPLLMAQATNARPVFDQGELTRVRREYSAFVTDLGLVGSHLNRGDRTGAIAELHAAAPHLAAVKAAARTANLVCQTKGSVLRIG
jgi:hypothetical protein